MVAAASFSYRRLQEQFVSDHNGTTTWEIATVVSSAPLGVLLRNCIVMTLNIFSIVVFARCKFAVDFVTLVLPVIACFTVLSDHASLMLSAMIAGILGMVLIGRHQFNGANPKQFYFKYVLDSAMVGKKPFVTNFRAYVNIATAISILAVDFVIYPRRFCKVETYGTGLMDVGVGAFVLSNAIVTPEARGKYPMYRSLRVRLSGLLKSIQSSLPLIVLGLCRLAAVKGSDYQEHVSEYGVHWNFFFTLAVVKVLSSAVLSVFDPSLSWLIAIAVASGYQYLLSGCNLRQYLLHGADGTGSRTGLLDANREGIFSCLGYLAVFFAGVQLGKFLWQPRVKLREWLWCLLLMVLLDVAFWVLLSYTEDMVEPVSRRMANLPYVIWMMAYNLQLLPSFLLVDILGVLAQETGILSGRSSGGSRKSTDICLLEASNRNGLFYFLLANLLTGAVNFSMATVTATPLTGTLIVTAYMLILSLIAVTLHVKNISVKFW